MSTIKEYVCYGQTRKRIIVRSDQYGASIEAINKMAREARKDFPEIADSELKIHHYGGICYRGTYGLEFETSGNIPEGYREIMNVEKTL